MRLYSVVFASVVTRINVIVCIRNMSPSVMNVVRTSEAEDGSMDCTSLKTVV